MHLPGVDQVVVVEDEDEVVRELLATGVDGIILPPPLCDSKRIHAVLTKAGALAVAVASASPRAGFLAVRIDDHAAAVAMTRHILSLGHTRIGFIIGNPDQTASAQRLAGYKAALAEVEVAVLGLAIRPPHVFAICCLRFSSYVHYTYRCARVKE